MQRISLFNNFLLINVTYISKISSDQKRFFFAVRLYPLQFFENTSFKTRNFYSSIKKNTQYSLYPLQGDDSSLPMCSVSRTVILQLFTNNDRLQIRPEYPYNKQICSTLSVQFMTYTISKGLAYIITLCTITSLILFICYFVFFLEHICKIIWFELFLNIGSTRF